MCVCVCVCVWRGGHKANDIHPSFAVSLRPMPRSIITCKKRQWWSWQPKKLCRGRFCPRLAKAEVEEG